MPFMKSFKSSQRKCMDKLKPNEVSIEEILNSDDDFNNAFINSTIEEIAESMKGLPPSNFSMPYKPNQTMNTEKISIRISCSNLYRFKAEAARLGIGYQTLINSHLNKSFK